jgi:hypothetical protein
MLAAGKITAEQAQNMKDKLQNCELEKMGFGQKMMGKGEHGFRGPQNGQPSAQQ